MVYVDAHFHLDLMPDPPGLLDSIRKRGHHVIAVTNAPSVFLATATLTAPATFVHPALGLHPELVSSHRHELPLFWRQFAQTRFIGEIGLDYVTQVESHRRAQREVFTDIVRRCDEAGDKILTIHSRRSASDVIEIVGGGFHGKAILHWFSGTLKELRRAIDCGFYLSVNTAMCRSEKGQRIIREIDPSRVLTETDGPFVTTNNRPAIPDDISRVVAVLAELWGCDAVEANERLLRTWTAVIAPNPTPAHDRKS